MEDYKEESKKVPLDKLYLDPNNFRFIDNLDYVEVPIEKALDPDKQRRTRGFIVGKNHEEVEDLIRSLKTNGYLPVDQIQVKPHGNGYLVVEGNRRVASLKYLKEQYERGQDIGAMNPELFQKVPVVITTGVDDTHYRILMGLKHISGNKKWPAVNQAKLLQTLVDQGMSKQEIKDAMGISMIALNRYLRILALIEQYKKSDYGDQFRAEKFNLFSELIKQRAVMDWIGWDETTYLAKNTQNLTRFFIWISVDELLDDSDSEGANSDKMEPILIRGNDLRDLGEIINDEKLLSQMEKTRNISKITRFSDQASKDKFENITENLDLHLTEAFHFISYADEENKEKLKKIKKRFEGLLAATGHVDVLKSSEIVRNILIQTKSSQFNSIYIKKYRHLQHLHIENLNRINLFGGNNNSGKTSLLEAVALLCAQNDLYVWTDLLRRRGKFSNGMPAAWLARNIEDHADVEGQFSGKNIHLTLFKEQEEEDFDKTQYLTSIFMNAQSDGIYSESKLRLFEQKENQSFFKQLNNLCAFQFSSPFVIGKNEDLLSAHEKSIESKSMQQIVSFLQEYVDPGIQQIELVGDLDYQRFVVTHNTFSTAVDLTSFGDGVQRIFRIAVLFAAAQNGVLLIDEVENAIHHSLFLRFTRLIEDLAERFNVQVFITSHSRECLDAFFDNGNKNGNLSAYRLEIKNGQINCSYTEGERFGRLIKNFAIDLRG